MSDSEESSATPEPPEEDEQGEEVADLRAERDELAARVEELEAERDELESRVKRTAADFDNYKKRQAQKREQAAAEATERLVDRLLDVRDNLQRAIDQSDAEGESLREGVKLTLAEFDRVLDAEDVHEISPAPGDEIDANRHEVMLNVDGEHPAGRIEEVYQAGYTMGDRVIRPAQVVVSTGPESEEQ